MTEDENGRVRASDEEVIYGMFVEEFFIKLLVFKERLEAKIEQINNAKNNT